jgi:hypothetical protein
VIDSNYITTTCDSPGTDSSGATIPGCAGTCPGGTTTTTTTTTTAGDTRNVYEFTYYDGKCNYNVYDYSGVYLAQYSTNLCVNSGTDSSGATLPSCSNSNCTSVTTTSAPTGSVIYSIGSSTAAACNAGYSTSSSGSGVGGSTDVNTPCGSFYVPNGVPYGWRCCAQNTTTTTKTAAATTTTTTTAGYPALLSGWHLCAQGDVPNPSSPCVQSQVGTRCVDGGASGASCPDPNATTTAAPTYCRTEQRIVAQSTCPSYEANYNVCYSNSNYTGEISATFVSCVSVATTAAPNCSTCNSYSPSDGSYSYTKADSGCASGERYYRTCITPVGCPNIDQNGSCVPVPATTTTTTTAGSSCSSPGLKYDYLSSNSCPAGCSQTSSGSGVGTGYSVGTPCGTFYGISGVPYVWKCCA